MKTFISTAIVHSKSRENKKKPFAKQLNNSAVHRFLFQSIPPGFFPLEITTPPPIMCPEKEDKKNK